MPAATPPPYHAARNGYGCPAGRTRQRDAATRKRGKPVALDPRQQRDHLVALQRPPGAIEPARKFIQGRPRRRRLRMRQQRRLRGTHQAMQVERAARLRPGAGQAPRHRRAGPDHRTDDVAIHVDLPTWARDDRCDGFVDARVNAQGESETGGVDVFHELEQLARAGSAAHAAPGRRPRARARRGSRSRSASARPRSRPAGGRER